MKNLLKIAKRDDGSISIEAMIMILFYAIWLTFSFVTFDVYLAYNKSNKAGATIANLVSRMDKIDNNYIDNIKRVYSNASGADIEKTWLRLTVIQNVGDEFKIRWSYTADDENQSDILENDSPLIEKYVPNVVVGDEIVYLQSRSSFSPIFKNTPWKDINFNQNIVFIPRFDPHLINEDLEDFDDLYDGSTEPEPGDA